ncbi:short-chain dehydrogenase [Rhizorhabdus wittichii DC-6]|nr:short-chain dehydrogenase [Rhizorhabdus wittichii DC-6]
MGRLSGKVAIITGGGQGVGQGIAQVFAREGARVLITGRTPDKLEAAVAELKAAGGDAAWIAGTAGVRADAEAAVARAVELFGGLDILVNNAQTSRPGALFEDTDDDLFALTINSGLYGTFQHMQAALPAMKKRGGGSIINFGSYEGIHGGIGFAAYAATKEAIRGLSRTAARELGKHKVRVNVICPAALSPIAEQWVKDFPEEAEKVMKLVALGYLGDCAEDIGPAALFLASDDSRYVTGQTINVDGGQMML